MLSVDHGDLGKPRLLARVKPLDCEVVVQFEIEE